MDIRNSLDGLRSLLGVNPTPQPAPQSKGRAATTGSGFDSDRATFSAAANEVSQALSDEGVRTDKVASIQSALAAGTYDVPAAAVASKLVDAMLSGA
ncbi:MAG: flagellar biosynthesis anti-sigma factor FlgM [Terracidiphilus sp.]|jgi:negative regulator of flagellin synthesis FlgM